MSACRGPIEALLALALAALAAWYGTGIIPRLSDHRGFHLVSSEDRVGVAYAPRRVYFVLVDGLRADFAAQMASAKRLGERGVCRRTVVSLPTVSRPVYAMLSSGVEQDRTGVRNNDDTRPAPVESVWQVARQSGRRVAAFSTLPWWQELWPDGFDRYETGTLDTDLFPRAAEASEDLVLVHPVHVDETGHQHGGSSAEYAAAVARADRELAELLARVDFERDVVVLTADHGHSDRGGHGGDQPEVATTLTCYAGRGVGHGGAPDAKLEERNLGPLVAVLAGLRFPRHMRPGLPEAVWADLADGLPAAYVADRRAAEARFAAAAAGLPAAYAEARRAQLVRGALAALVILLGAGGFAVRARGARGALALAAWIVAMSAAQVCAYVLVRGSFDATSINLRADWIRASLLIGLGVGGAGALLRAAVFHRGPTPVGDQLALAGAGVAVAAVHAVAFGWILGFPLPGPALFFLPFFLASFVGAHALVALALSGYHAWRRSP